MSKSSRFSPNRRSVLKGLAAAPLLTNKASAQSSNPDVIIVGAGIAGLQAAMSLMESGKSVVVFEAADRIGGRAYTETNSFGSPFDQGCSWINAASENPYLRLARQHGFVLVDHSGANEAFFVDGRRASEAELAEYYASYDAIIEDLGAAGQQGVDISGSDAIKGDRKFSGVAQTWMGAMDMGVDFKNMSTLDFWQGADSEPSYMVRQGLGALAARNGADVPVQLNTPVTGVDWSGQGVVVETASGSLPAKACIVTVSTGVLNAGTIRFTPDLPVATQEAIDGLPMGLLAKVGLQFRGEKFGLGDNEWLTHSVPNDMPAEACYFLTWPFGFDYMVGFVGGDFGWELSRAGEAAAIDFALNEIVKIAGSDARKAFVKGAFTPWAENPLTLGAYAAAKPGRYKARRDLAKPVGDRVFFAGEALGGAHAALCSGAFFSGEDAAWNVLDVI
ncbi:MAG: FAD-dependent oxidoreductase [Pseudomonadota bacterium]